MSAGDPAHVLCLSEAGGLVGLELLAWESWGGRTRLQAQHASQQLLELSTSRACTGSWVRKSARR